MALTPEEIQKANAVDKTDGVEQLALFKTEEWWEKDWGGMPEFVQNDLTPFKSINVHFANRKDMENFSNLVGQKINSLTQCIWHPKAEIGKISDKRYVDES